MDRRVEEFESGKVKGIPWEEVHNEALERLKNKEEWKIALSIFQKPKKNLMNH